MNILQPVDACIGHNTVDAQGEQAENICMADAINKLYHLVIDHPRTSVVLTLIGLGFACAPRTSGMATWFFFAVALSVFIESLWMQPVFSQTSHPNRWKSVLTVFALSVFIGVGIWSTSPKVAAQVAQTAKTNNEKKQPASPVSSFDIQPAQGSRKLEKPKQNMRSSVKNVEAKAPSGSPSSQSFIENNGGKIGSATIDSSTIEGKASPGDSTTLLRLSNGSSVGVVNIRNSHLYNAPVAPPSSSPPNCPDNGGLVFEGNTTANVQEDAMKVVTDHPCGIIYRNNITTGAKNGLEVLPASKPKSPSAEPPK